jgi:peroxiredoxin
MDNSMKKKERINISIGLTVDGVDDDSDMARKESFLDCRVTDEVVHGGSSILQVEPKKLNRRRSSAMEEDEFYPTSLQEELNEIMEAFYAAISEEDIQMMQRLIESNFQRSIAEGAVHAKAEAPDFDLEDQDGDQVKLSELYKKGPVVLIFYRGKWCPHCNATILAMSRAIEKFQAKGATLVAISPMLPDGTKYLATKRFLEFPVCSDVGNVVARRYRLTFEIPPEFHDSMLKWGEDVPSHNGDDSWEIPLPATYIIDTKGIVVWSFVDNDPGVRASPEEIIAKIPPSKGDCPSWSDIRQDQTTLAKEGAGGEDRNGNSKDTMRRFPDRRHLSSTFKTMFVKRLFGKKKQEPMDFVIQNYLLPEKNG